MSDYRTDPAWVDAQRQYVDETGGLTADERLVNRDAAAREMHRIEVLHERQDRTEEW